MAGNVFKALCYLLAITYVNGLQTVNGKIKITVGTTAGCGDTVTFVRDQMADVYETYREFLEIEFVPWGRTVRNQDGSLTCQFGVNDCWANRLHRCVINMLKNNPDAQMHYMTCEFTTPFPSFREGSYICAYAVGLSLIDVDNCVENTNDSLDQEAEAIGSQLTQAINFIPSIVFNDQIDLELHRQSLTRLKSMICFALAEDPSTGITSCRI